MVTPLVHRVNITRRYWRRRRMLGYWSNWSIHNSRILCIWNRIGVRMASRWIRRNRLLRRCCRCKLLLLILHTWRISIISRLVGKSSRSNIRWSNAVFSFRLPNWFCGNRIASGVVYWILILIGNAWLRHWSYGCLLLLLLLLHIGSCGYLLGLPWNWRVSSGAWRLIIPLSHSHLLLSYQLRVALHILFLWQLVTTRIYS